MFIRLTTQRSPMLPCRHCGAQNRSCYDGCRCAKCLDPVGYEAWKMEHPEEYDRYLGEILDDEEWYRYNARLYGFG